MGLDYLKKHRKTFFVSLLTSGKLTAHLREVDQTADERFELLTAQMAERVGVTERLKAENQMLWMRKMNGIRNRVEETIRSELIYS